MTKLTVFKNEVFEVKATLEDGTVLFDAEQVAKCLGIIQNKNGREYVRWERVNEYLPTVSPEVGKGKLLPESMVYMLAFKASNDVAVQFQLWLATEVIPAIRQNGMYISTDATDEQKLYNYDLLDATFSKIGVEHFADEYKACIDFHVKNKTRLNYEKSSKNRRSDKKLTVAESKIKIMNKILSIAKEREQQYRINFSWELKSLISDVVKQISLDIKEVKHNQTRGKLSQAKKAI